jgi:hypothetical protein
MIVNLRTPDKHSGLPTAQPDHQIYPGWATVFNG